MRPRGGEDALPEVRAGIRMPASFDLAGIFDLVCQILGLTWPRLRGKVVDLIGEDNTERLEFVAGYLQALVTGGFAGLWDKVQQDLLNLWNMVVGGIDDAVLEAIGGMRSLEHIELRGTEASDAGLQHLASVASLEHVAASGPRMTAAGLAALSARMPSCWYVG